MKPSGLEDNVKDTIRHYGLLDPVDTVIVGVSGGADSVALLHALVRLNGSQGYGWRLIVAHVNHMLRGDEAAEDERFVRDLAGSLGLEYHARQVDVREEASREGTSIETAARNLRYSFFGELAEETQARRVAVGHTADDNAETVLHRIIRGTGLLGLGGIRPSREFSAGSASASGSALKVMLVRPLLHAWRSEVLSYISERGLKYRIDSSNLQPGDNLRNRIRLELLPLLEKDYNPQVKEILTRLGDITGRSNDFLQSRINMIVKANLEEVRPGVYSFEADLLKHHPPFFQHFFIKEVCSRIGLPLGKMDYGHYNRVIEMADGSVTHKQIELPGKWTAHLEGDKLCFQKAATLQRKHAPGFEPVELNLPGVTRLPDGREVRAEVIPIEDGFVERFRGEKTPDEEAIDADRAGKRLYVRTRREGDRFQPLGVGGEKKLKDFLIDTKTPRWERDDILIVASDVHPVWVVGFRIDDRVKITPETKRVLRLSVR